MTETVLLKVGRADLASALGNIASKVETASSALAEEEELLADCPDEFLCPIMSIVMKDPVSRADLTRTSSIKDDALSYCSNFLLKSFIGISIYVNFLAVIIQACP